MLYPGGSTFSLPGSSFSPQAPPVPQQFLSQQQRQQLQLAVGNGHMSMPIINIPGSDAAAAMARNLQTQRWLQSHSNLYELYNSSQTRAASAISGMSGRSSVSGIPDDVSTMSHMSEWTVNIPSLGSHLNQLANTASIENLDPNQKSVLQLCEFNCDGDEKLLMEWAFAVEGMLHKNIDLPGNVVHPLARRIVAYLSSSEAQTMDEKICNVLLFSFIKLSKMPAFQGVEKEIAYSIFVMYRILFTRRIRRILRALGLLNRAFSNSAEALQEAAKDEKFIHHIGKVLRTDQPSSVQFEGITVMRHLLRAGVKFQNDEIAALIQLICSAKCDKVCQYSLNILEKLLKCTPDLPSFIVANDGVKVIFQNAAYDNVSKAGQINLKTTQRVITILRDLSSEKEIGNENLSLGIVVHQLISLLFFLRNKLCPKGREAQLSLIKITEVSFNFIRNVLARSIDAMTALSTDVELFRHIARFLFETFTYFKNIQRHSGQQKWQNLSRNTDDVIVYTIFDDTLTILTGLNKNSNPRRQMASEMINHCVEFQEVIQFFADYDSEDMMIYRRLIKCWYNMITCGIMPTNMTGVSNCLLRFIRIWNKQKLSGFTTPPTDLTPSKAFEVLSKIAENTNHFENITNFFKGEVNLFALLQKITEPRDCVAILTLIDVIFTKDYSLQLAWADVDTSIIRLCEASTNPLIAELSQKIQQKLKRDDYTMTDVIMTSFGSFGQ